MNNYMTETTITNHTHHEDNDTTFLGFWIYLMTDLIMFAVLFATYAVLHTSTAGGPGSHELFDLQFVLVETLILLTSSFTIGLAMLGVKRKNKNSVLLWLITTFILGAIFLTMELIEFSHLISEGASFTKSAFLSAYFGLVGTHGLHIAAGLLWIIVLLFILVRKGLSSAAIRKLTLLSLFWHFLDLVWIFIFTIVYLMGTMK
jgi:cytochrome o ubiquinol oxidase subunit 3